MEYYQQVQNRAQETAAVISVHVPTLLVGNFTGSDLLMQRNALDGLAATRDARLVTFDEAVNAEFGGFSLIRKMALNLPQVALGELDDEVTAEAALADLLDPAFGIVPDMTETAMKRGQKVKAALLQIDAYLAAQSPSRGPITTGGRGVTELTQALAAQEALETGVATAEAQVSAARTALRTAARALDRLNKRFYKKLVAESQDNAALAAALGQIETENANQPATLGIRKILQGGAGGLQLLISYDNGSFDDTLENTLESMVEGVDQEFTHTVAADPSGNALGPYTAGQVVKLRTRTRNANGTTTGSVRTLTIQPPA
jgi:hypothetical protein